MGRGMELKKEEERKKTRGVKYINSKQKTNSEDNLL